MEPDTPLHLKEYPKPDPRLSDVNKYWIEGGFPTTCPWDPNVISNISGSVYARTYEDAVSQCKQGVDILPGTWRPDNVDDFWVSSLRRHYWGWRWWGGNWCWFDEEDIENCDSENFWCYLNNWGWRAWHNQRRFSIIVAPTASIFGKNLPGEGSEGEWIGEPGIMSTRYPYLPGYSTKELWWYPDDRGPYDYGWHPGYNPFEFFSDGSSLVEGGIPTGLGSIIDGNIVQVWQADNWELAPISNYHDKKGICLDVSENTYDAIKRWTGGGSSWCTNSWSYWRCRCDLCNDPCSSGLLPRQHPNAPRQPEGPRLPETINQGKYIDPRQAGIEIPKSQDASACCVANYEGDKFTCSYMTRKDCEMQNGFFNIPDEDGPITCSKTICPALPTRSKSGFVTPPSIKASDLPEPGKLFAGGVYIGTFKPGISQVLTSVETGSTGRLKTCSADGPGDKRSWAIILAPTDLGAEFGLDSMMYRYITASEKIPQTQTSLFDGLYNTYGNDKSVRQAKTSLMKQIKNYNLYGFKDWYLPSVEELGFVGAQQRDLDFGVNLGRYSQNQSKLGSDTPYMTSSRKISKKKPSKSLTRDFTSYPSANLVYGVLVGNSLGPMNGFTILSGLDNTFRVRLARRIYVED